MWIKSSSLFSSSGKFLAYSKNVVIVQTQVQFISHIQIKIILPMITKVKAAHGEEALKETTGLIRYETPEYR